MNAAAMVSTILVLGLGAPTPPAPVKTWEYHSHYYIIDTDLPEARAKLIGAVMDAAGKAYDGKFRDFAGKVTEKPHVRVYATREQYMQECARLCGDANPGSGGLYCLRDRVVYTYDNPGLERTLKHECFHQFVDRVVGGELPAWLNEGLAEYFSEGMYNARDGLLRLGRVPQWRLDILRNARRNGSWIPVAKLLSLDYDKWNDTLRRGTASVEYCEAWLLCHFLVHGDNGKYAGYFDRYLHKLDKGADPQRAFDEVFGPDKAPLEQSLDAYLDGLREVPFGTPQ